MNGVEVLRSAGETLLVFEPVLDILGARALYGCLSGVLAEGKSVELDAGQVERVDTAALQLLAAFCRAVREAGVSLRWRNASGPLCEAAALLGLSEILGQPK